MKLKLILIIIIINIFAFKAHSLEPDKFDLRDYQRVTAPKFQNMPGPCWAFASLSACESNYLTQKFNFINNINLSAMHLAYLAHENFTPFDKSGGVLGAQGNAFISTAILSSLNGPVSEHDAPYSMQALNNFNNLKFKNILRVTDVLGLSLSQEPSDNNIKKYLIKTHGAILASFYSDFNKYKAINNFYTYFNNSQGRRTTHDVILIGWDDNFSRDNFLPRPKRNGAWLAQNSWGSGWGVTSSRSNLKQTRGILKSNASNKQNYNSHESGGYFWISYEQYLRGGSAFITSKPDKLLKHYGHDNLGWCKNLKFNYAANIFKIKTRREILKEIAFYTARDNANYEIYIYDLNFNEPSDPVTNGKLLYKSQGKIKFSGYHTIKLNLQDLNQIILKQNQYFSVIIKLDCPQACECKIKNYSDKFKINKHESYFSNYLNKNWLDGADLREPANACIKAFTKTLF